MALPQQIRNATFAIVLSGVEVSTVPKDARPLPSIEALSEKYQHPEVMKLAKAKELSLGRKIRPQNPAHVFKGGVKTIGSFRAPLAGGDSVGFWFLDLALLIDSVADLCMNIFSDHVGYMIFAPWEDYAIIYEIVRQGETTHDAMERTVKEAAECCKSVASASQVTLKTMMETVKQYTYKADDNAPRTTKKKRTRL